MRASFELFQTPYTKQKHKKMMAASPRFTCWKLATRLRILKGKKKKIVKFAQKSMAHKTSQAIVSALMFVSA